MSQEIPLRPASPSYNQSITLDETPIQLSIRWNGRDGAWYLDIMDQAGNNLILGIKIVTGWELIGRFTNPALPPGRLLVVDLDDQKVEPDRDDLGSSIILVYFTESELG